MLVDLFGVLVVLVGVIACLLDEAWETVFAAGLLLAIAWLLFLDALLICIGDFIISNKIC